MTNTYLYVYIDALSRRETVEQIYKSKNLRIYTEEKNDSINVVVMWKAEEEESFHKNTVIFENKYLLDAYQYSVLDSFLKNLRVAGYTAPFLHQIKNKIEKKREQ